MHDLFSGISQSKNESDSDSDDSSDNDKKEKKDAPASENKKEEAPQMMDLLSMDQQPAQTDLFGSSGQT